MCCSVRKGEVTGDVRGGAEQPILIFVMVGLIRNGDRKSLEIKAIYIRCTKCTYISKGTFNNLDPMELRGMVN